MKRIIHKYNIVYASHIEPYIEKSITVPAGSVIQSVAEQNGKIVLYALEFAESTELVTYQIAILGTGNEISAEMDIDRWQFVGTVNLHDGRLMFHVYVRLIRR